MRVRNEHGFALPLALSILTLMGLFVLAAVGFATHNTDRASRDLASTRALAAADAGIESAIYRMNKAIIASQVSGVTPVPTALLAEAKCLDISVSALQVTNPLASGWCAATSDTEELDGAAAAGGNWTPAEFSYSVSLGVNVGTTLDKLIERKIVATGQVDDVTKRVLAKVQLPLTGSGALKVDPSTGVLKVFEQVSYKQCASAVPSGSDPSAGC